MRIYCCQYDIAWEDHAANVTRIADLLEAAKLESGGQGGARGLVLLPEMCLSGFSLDVSASVSSDDGALADLAKRFGVYLMAGLVRRDAQGRGLNQAVIFSPQGEVICIYTKLHLFSFAREDTQFTAGTTHDSFTWADTIVAPRICYDLRFPEIFRTAVTRGAQVLTVIANWPAARENHWVTLLRARAIENQCYVASCNRIGDDPNTSHNGRSLIIDPRGKILADAGGESTVIHADIDIEGLRSYREKFPALKDRRF